MMSCVSCGSGSAFISKTMQSSSFISPIGITVTLSDNARPCNRISRNWVRASMVDSSSDFVRRMEKTWLISQQPRPIVCSSCKSKGQTECNWCGGTGFFIIGDNMLCEIPSKNTSCIICYGKGSMCCSDCQGTGFRAKWLEEPPISK
ncbi:Heat shock protein DnaJ, cysteine-rich domain superfamily [Sesbania bispinosa]|nr:Heat shock protein DnaJ, cysteine-rich domain superfamily [Sesbania bispinosa]